MSRDNLKLDEYFVKYINIQRMRIDKFLGVLSKIDKKDSAKIQQCNRYLANYYFDLFVAEYSYGTPKSELTKIFLSYVNALEIAGVDSYSEMIELLSIGIWLEVQAELNWVDQITTFDDGLVGILKACISGNKYDVVDDLMYPEYYGVFLK